MVKPLDWVVSVVPVTAAAVEAVTRTGVLTLPALTMICAKPAASVVAVAVAGVSVIPPTAVLNPKLTLLPLIGFPPVSSTLKTTVEVSTPPIPFKDRLAGVAETNWIEPVAGGTTARLVAADVTPAAEAVMASVPAQPLSRYDAVATPATVVTPELSTALPLLAHADEKVTFCGVLTGTPLLNTATLTLVVPNAESGAAPTPVTGAVIVIEAVPTLYPIEPLTAAEPTCALALMVVAPAAVRLAALSVTVATPEALVKAVADGVSVARAASVLKVTTALGTAAPAASFTAAFTVAGEAVEMELTAAPVASLNAIVMLGAAALGVPVSVAGVVGFGSPTPQPALTAIVAARKSRVGNIESFWLKKTRARKFRTQVSRLRDARTRYCPTSQTAQQLNLLGSDRLYPAFHAPAIRNRSGGSR